VSRTHPRQAIKYHGNDLPAALQFEMVHEMQPLGVVVSREALGERICREESLLEIGRQPTFGDECPEVFEKAPDMRKLPIHKNTSLVTQSQEIVERAIAVDQCCAGARRQTLSQRAKLHITDLPSFPPHDGRMWKRTRLVEMMLRAPPQHHQRLVGVAHHTPHKGIKQFDGLRRLAR
jgi:hypothetical protein